MGRGVKDSPSPLTIMWTQSMMPSSFDKFAANHFCVLQKRIVDLTPCVVIIPEDSLESISTDSDQSDESGHSSSSVWKTANKLPKDSI